MVRNKIAIFIDSFREKNRLQYELMTEFGYQTAWFQTARTISENVNSIVVLKEGFFSRLFQMIAFFKANSKTIHHTEIYPGGRFAFLYLLLSKIYGIPVLCCERGDIYYYVKKKYDLLTRISQLIIYKYADFIWLRELFAEDYLKKINVKKDHFFIHNVVPIPEMKELPGYAERDIDFLWVNSLKSFRRPEWFGEALDEPEFSDTKNVLLGITSGVLEHEYAKIDKKNNLEVFGFEDPREYYLRAKFFVMPASVVYLNHALLEAMSYGVVPLITEAQGADLIIQHNYDGYICEYKKESFIESMKKMFQMTQKDYAEISLNARKKIMDEYSIAYYRSEFKKMYDSIH